MTATTAPNGGPTSLQSKDHRDLLDVIDRLRSQGLGRFVDLPQIIVCGDQSSGKSSALEAISGMSFPTKDNLCTRFATELILRRADKADDEVDIGIIPGPEHTKDEKAKLRKFTYTGTLADLDLGQVVEEAKTVMGLSGNSRVFSTDILRVEISGPEQPHLTMVDLPGLFVSGNTYQSDEDAVLVEKLVLSYMENPRTIILAVVSANSDFTIQSVTKHTRNLDPQGIRTMGLITKPDKLDEGSETERFYIELAQNKDVQFRLGWHVLRNRGYRERGHSASTRDATEMDFFSKGIWTALKPSQLGVEALRTRLSNVLRDQILRQIPNVLADATAGIQDCKDSLARLGSSRTTIADQRRYLLGVSAKFTDLTRAAVDGVYTDAFLRGAYERRLRAVVQNTLSEFASDMHRKGHARAILDDESGPEEEKEGEEEDMPPSVYRSAYIEEVKGLMRETRGRELPGTYNPLIVAELFSAQCKPWQGMVDGLLDRLLRAASTTVESILRNVADGETAEALLRYVVIPASEDIKQAVTIKAQELMEPHISGHPITYNHYLTDTVQKAQSQRIHKRLEDRLKSYFGHEDIDETVQYSFRIQTLLDYLTNYTEPDMDTYACSMAIDMMEAYYKVALKTLVDEVSTLAIEKCLLQKLPSILSPEMVCTLTDEEVQRIAAETSESAAERAQATEKQAVLDDALIELKRLKMHSAPIVDDANA